MQDHRSAEGGGGGKPPPLQVIDCPPPKISSDLVYLEIDLFLEALYGLKYYKSAKKCCEKTSGEAKI